MIEPYVDVKQTTNHGYIIFYYKIQIQVTADIIVIHLITIPHNRNKLHFLADEYSPDHLNNFVFKKHRRYL